METDGSYLDSSDLPPVAESWEDEAAVQASFEERRRPRRGRSRIPRVAQAAGPTVPPTRVLAGNATMVCSELCDEDQVRILQVSREFRDSMYAVAKMKYDSHRDNPDALNIFAKHGEVLCVKMYLHDHPETSSDNLFEAYEEASAGQQTFTAKFLLFRIPENEFQSVKLQVACAMENVELVKKTNNPAIEISPNFFMTSENVLRTILETANAEILRIVINTDVRIVDSIQGLIAYLRQPKGLKYVRFFIENLPRAVGFFFKKLGYEFWRDINVDAKYVSLVNMLVSSKGYTHEVRQEIISKMVNDSNEVAIEFITQGRKADTQVAYDTICQLKKFKDFELFLIKIDRKLPHMRCTAHQRSVMQHLALGDTDQYLRDRRTQEYLREDYDF